jgi:hypothetical protein
MERIIGRTPVDIIVDESVDRNDTITMKFSDGSVAKWCHWQDCCECVSIEDVVGDWADLIGHPLLVAEERTDDGDDSDYESSTWTFYTFRSIGGSVDVRWFGSSNGYYSEDVSFEFKESQ